MFLVEGTIISIHKNYCSKIKTKSKEFLPSNIKVYAQNICQFKKCRIELKTKLIVYSDTSEVAKFVGNDCHKAIINVTDISYDKNNIDYIRVNLL